jgi:hypothetical protein
MNVRFCPSCRSLILSDFRFCPYCGSPAPRGPELAEALDGPFSKIESSVPPDGREAGRFAELENALARLEADMDLLLGELEEKGGKRGL